MEEANAERDRPPRTALSSPVKKHITYWVFRGLLLAASFLLILFSVTGACTMSNTGTGLFWIITNQDNRPFYAIYLYGSCEGVYTISNSDDSMSDTNTQFRSCSYSMGPNFNLMARAASLLPDGFIDVRYIEVDRTAEALYGILVTALFASGIAVIICGIRCYAWYKQTAKFKFLQEVPLLFCVATSSITLFVSAVIITDICNNAVKEINMHGVDHGIAASNGTMMPHLIWAATIISSCFTVWLGVHYYHIRKLRQQEVAVTAAPPAVPVVARPGVMPGTMPGALGYAGRV